MAKWLQSGRRRDICIVLAAEGELPGQRVKSELESRYDEHIEPKAFYGSLSALVDTGFVEERTEGIQDLYALTEAGERRLREQFEWMSGAVEGGNE
ncbi:PadR family transcriptional regulator [Saliphagus sp. LR7]|uniref:PadR family transcriptional regulator n=1 Tax=Saliphagus sp. LR7 TaxID=2282654 RepID=UPI000DF7771E|nr:PadR family transcriptional regulator [Saliphagus sp. LR7]